MGHDERLMTLAQGAAGLAVVVAAARGAVAVAILGGLIHEGIALHTAAHPLAFCSASSSTHRQNALRTG